MISLRGPKLKIFAGVLAALCLLAGVYFTFFHSRGFVKTSAVIVDLEADTTDGDTTYWPTHGQKRAQRKKPRLSPRPLKKSAGKEP